MIDVFNNFNKLKGFTSYFNTDYRLFLVLNTILKYTKISNIDDVDIYFDSNLITFPEKDKKILLNIFKYSGRYTIIEFKNSEKYDTYKIMISLVTDLNNTNNYELSDTDLYNLSFCYFYHCGNYLIITTLNCDCEESGLGVINKNILY